MRQKLRQTIKERLIGYPIYKETQFELYRNICFRFPLYRNFKESVQKIKRIMLRLTENNLIYLYSTYIVYMYVYIVFVVQVFRKLDTVVSHRVYMGIVPPSQMYTYIYIYIYIYIRNVVLLHTELCHCKLLLKTCVCLQCRLKPFW